MPFDRSWQSLWRSVALSILLAYPIMAIKWIPFGGGARYLSILVAPVSLLLLIRAPRDQLEPLALEAWHWSKPFLPFIVVWMVAQAWHGYDPIDAAPFWRLVWCALLFASARIVGVSYRHLAIVAGLGAVAYLAVALVEVFGMGRPRAWGGTYENRFGQYAVWMTALCYLHLSLGKPQRMLRGWLIVASVAGLIAALLSGSRGALLALALLIFVVSGRGMNWRRRLLFVLTGVAALAALSFLYAPIQERFGLLYKESVDYFVGSEFGSTSTGIRLELFRVAFLMLLDHPVLGPGYRSLKELYEAHPALGVPSQEMLGIPGFHSDWGHTVGLGGGSLLLALLSSCFLMWKASRGDVFRQTFLFFAVVFSFSEIFFSNKLGLSLLMATWALYSAAAQVHKPSV